jgi:transcriptional regulator with XRE-family HTH domain
MRKGISPRSKARIALDPEAIGLRIRSARRHRGWRQKDLGEGVGVAGSTVSAWERGFRIPEVRTCVAIAVVLHRSLEHVLLGLARRSDLCRGLFKMGQPPLACPSKTARTRSVQGPARLAERAGPGSL